jgi:hypothetical protein
MGIEPMLGANRFRVDFLEKDSTPYIAIRQRRPDLVVSLRRMMTNVPGANAQPRSGHQAPAD